MIAVLSAAQMRAFDTDATDRGVPSLVLMENAGRGACDVLARELLGGSCEGKIVAVVCGAGNNGGDGLVVARHLLTRGATVLAWRIGAEDKLTSDARTNHEAFVGSGGSVREIGDAPSPDVLSELVEGLALADVVVDAVFGTGLNRAVAAAHLAVLERMAEAPTPRLALDVPSGMDADRGTAHGFVCRADVTVTFAHAKLGHLTGAGARASGRLHVVDIGVPPLHASADGSATPRDDVSAWLVEARDVASRVPRRDVDAHKYRAGHVAVLGGSPGKLGAAVMTARGAMRAGAGAVTIVTWADVAAAFEARSVETMTARLHRGGELTRDLDAALAGMRAVVAGPGFGVDPDARAALDHVLTTFEGPVVLDADALTAYAGEPESLSGARGPLLLTPHAGELARLLGVTAEDVERDRFAAALSAAERTGAAVLLKGPHTVVASPDGLTTVNATGNPLLATAGSGDVLAGICGALACSLSPHEAGWCGAWLHGAAADAWRTRVGDTGMLASEIADELPAVLRALVG